GNIAAALEAPDLLAGLEVVRAGVAHPIDDDLRLWSDLVHCWRAPGRHIVARRAPEFAAGSDIERSEKRPFLHVGLNDDYAVMDDWRASSFPLRVGHHVEAGVEDTEVLLPEQLAFQVVRVKSFGAEEGDEMFAVGRRRRVGMRGFRMALDFRHARI